MASDVKRKLLQAIRFKVTGKVQGVFFRKHTRAKARELGLVGWVMNKPDKTVVGEAQGSVDALASFQEWLQTEGSPKSRVDACEVEVVDDALEKAAFSKFSIRR